MIELGNWNTGVNMKAKVIHEYFGDDKEDGTTANEYTDVFVREMQRSGWGEVSSAEEVGRPDWFRFIGDKFNFLYHRSWLEFDNE